MIRAADFIDALRARGYSHFSGVPCSFLKPFINGVINDPSLCYIGAASEGEAVGLMLGAHLAGRKTVAMCQNSGLGNMVNPLTSLNFPFRIPTLLITTWRGEPGVKDEPQHEQMGRITHRLLETMEIPWRAFPREPEAVGPALDEAEASMAERSRPFALVMSEGTVAEEELHAPPPPQPLSCQIQRWPSVPAPERLIRTEALQILLEELAGHEAILGTTGKTGRELFTIADRPNHLYVVGGMGTASAIGLGVAQALPKQPVVVIDGDGAALMKMGNFATIGSLRPENLLHVLLDNEAHDSTGGQRTVSGLVDFAGVAAATSYRHAFTAERGPDVRQAIQLARQRPGPTLLHVRIRPGSPASLGRPTVKPHEVKDRFMAFLREQQQARANR